MLKEGREILLDGKWCWDVLGIGVRSLMAAKLRDEDGRQAGRDVVHV